MSLYQVSRNCSVLERGNLLDIVGVSWNTRSVPNSILHWKSEEGRWTMPTYIYESCSNLVGQISKVD